MELSLEGFLQMLAQEPLLGAAVLLTLAVIFVNGWTDAPNAIATVVGTGAMGMDRAIALAAVCNFFGVLVMTGLNAAVAMTVSSLVDFGSDSRQALTALTAALLAIVLWAVAAWAFSIPTSESHALIAALTGAALALQGNLSAVNGAAWGRVLWGLAASVLLGFSMGWLLCVLIRRVCGGRRQRFFQRAQIFGGAAMAFMHGAQDGQKFLGVLLLTAALGHGSTAAGAEIPIWLMLLCSVVMAAGTAVGGRRIIRAVGMDMVHLTSSQGFAADLAGALALLFSTLLGLPTSTTHTKTTAIMGAGTALGWGAVDLRIVRGIFRIWILTFPGCGILGYGLARLFVHLGG